MSQVNFYLTHAHSARMRTTFIGIGLGAVVGALVEAMWGEFQPAFVACIVVTGAVEIIGALLFSDSAWKNKKPVENALGRRSLIWSAVSAAVLLVVPDFVGFEAIERSLQRAAENPTDPRNIREAIRALNWGSTTRIPVPSSTIENIGKIFVDASDKNPAAWGVVLASVGYRSVLNASNSPAAREAFAHSSVPRWEAQMRVFVNTRGPGSVSITYPNRLVPMSEAFILEPINGANFPLQLPLAAEGHPYARVTGTTLIRLDGMRLKNVIFDGVRVNYTGSPLIMEGVYFVNCKFEVAPPKRTATPRDPNLLFAEAVLTNVPTNISIGAQA